jgi:hypothetical protein
MNGPWVTCRNRSLVTLPIVGGSLAGLATAIDLARREIPVNVFEQNTGEERAETGLGIDRALVTETTGVDAHVDGLTCALPVVNQGCRDTSIWRPSIDGYQPKERKRTKGRSRARDIVVQLVAERS